MDGDVQRLRSVAWVVAPDADVPQRQLLAQAQVGFEPRPLLRRGGRLNALLQGAPIGEVLAYLLPAVDDRIGQVSGLVLREALGAQQRVVLLARHRELRQWQHAHDGAIVCQVDVVARIALGVVRLAGAL